MLCRSLLLLLVLAVTALPLAASDFGRETPLPESFNDSVAAKPQPGQPTTDSTDGVLWRAGAGLGVLAVLFGFGVWWMRSNPRLRRALGGTGMIKVLSRAWIGGKHQLILVKFGDRALLVGTSPAGIRALSEVTDPVQVARLVASSEEGGKARASFRQTLRESAGGPVPAAPVHEETARRIASLRSEISRLAADKESS